MAKNRQQRADNLKRRREAKARKRANRPAPEDPGLGSLENPIRLDSREGIADLRRREAEARERANRPAPQDPGLRSLDPPLRPWVTPNRGEDAAARAPGRQRPRPQPRGVEPRGPPGPGAIVIDLEAEEDALSSGNRAGRKSRFGFPGIKDEVIDLEALLKEEELSSSGTRGGRKVRFAAPGQIKEVVDIGPRIAAKQAALRPGAQIGRKTRRAPPGPTKKVVDIDAAEGSSSSRPRVGEADSENTRAARERARQLERSILGYRAGGSRDTEPGQRAGRRAVQVHSKRRIPLGFEVQLEEAVLEETEGLSQAVVDYYRNEMMRRDSRNIPGRFGQPSLVEEVLHEDALERLRGRTGPGWRPVRELGSGGQGGVTLWEMNRTDGQLLQLATKDMSYEYSFFRDYNNEGHITRRLNEAGCENVITVLEWALLEKPQPKFRTAYEVAEYGDLQDLIDWYEKHGLIFPEHFIWHIWHSLANALTYQALGHNTSKELLPEWEEIVHGDLKPPNILICAPNPNAHSTPHAHYPTFKVADYGFAFTIPLDRADVRAFKSTYNYGTEGYRAPEVDKDAEETPYPLHGAHTDVYSVACVFLVIYNLFHQIRSRSAKPVSDPYPPRLNELIEACLQVDGRDRPKAYDLFVETGREVRSGREAFEAGVRTAERGGADHGIYPGKVLMGKEEQRRFETDMAYREAYKKVNLKGVYERIVQQPRARTARGHGGGRGGGGGAAAAAGDDGDEPRSKAKAKTKGRRGTERVVRGRVMLRSGRRG